MNAKQQYLPVKYAQQHLQLNILSMPLERNRYCVGTLHLVKSITVALDASVDPVEHFVHVHASTHAQMHELVSIVFMTASAMLSRLLQMVMQKAIARNAQSNAGAGLAGTQAASRAFQPHLPIGPQRSGSEGHR